MKNFLKNRQCVIKDINSSDVDSCITKMLDYLGGELWIKDPKNADHPIVKLWKRKDFIATNELITFANAVNNLDRINQQWIAQTMKIVAGSDYNNVRGAIFEIQTLSVFHESGCTVTPCRQGNAGVDGIIELPDESKLNLSIKSFGMSTRERDFHSFMMEINSLVDDELNRREVLSADVRICMNKYIDLPQEKDSLRGLAIAATEEYERQLAHGNATAISNNIASVIIYPITGYQLSETYKSHKLIVISPMHKNELKVLTDKIDDACCNLINYAPKGDKSESTTYNGIWIHIHADADGDSYYNYLKDYLDEKASDTSFPIDFIALYQAGVAYDIESSEYGICHGIKYAFSDKRFETLRKPKPQFPPITYLIGSTCPDFPRKTIFTNNGGVSLNNCYLFQKGDIYINGQLGADGSLISNLQIPSPGVTIHLVVDDGMGNALGITPISLDNDFLEIT